MRLRKGFDFVRQNFIFYLTGLLMILGLKCYYRQADCDSLLWILAPTVYWVELLSNIPFTYISGAGYVNHSLRMVVASSCSGVRFMIITFATLVFTFVPVIASAQYTTVFRSSENTKEINDLSRNARGLGWIAASAVLSWLFTVFVNGLRIMIAIYLPSCLESLGLMQGILTPDRLHTMIGVVVYFMALLTIYRLAGRFVRGMTGTALPSQEKKDFLLTFVRKCVPPVFWYFTFMLGIPFLGRIYGEGSAEFTEFAVLVMGCCVFILLPYIIVLLLRRHKPC